MYPLGLDADNSEALILLPTLFFDFGNETLRRGMEIEKELRTAYRDCDLDVNDLVEIYDVRKKEGYANADTMAVYEFLTADAKSLYADSYEYCVGLYLRKLSHPALLIKILLTPEGYAHKNDYIRTV